jgi:hypothetical protein
VLVLFSSPPLLGQQKQSPTNCVANEQAVLKVEHQLWAAPRTRDVATLDKLTDDGFISTDDNGRVRGKKEVLAGFRQPEGSFHNETDEQPANVRLAFTNGVAILNFTKHGTEFDKEAGVTVELTSVITRVFTCKGGEWKSIASHETGIPNKNRRPAQQASDHLDDYVGRYRFGENGDKGEVSVVRNGNKLFETWPGDKPIEILPGKYDTFFTREDGWVERFIRDKSGQVTGILYTYPDGEIEAKRTQ